MNERVVIKFGGADLATGEMIRKAASMVVNSKYKESVIVVSAIKGVTDNLIDIISKIEGIRDEDYAEIISMGERTSARIFCTSLKSLGANALFLEPGKKEWPIITDSNYKDAKPNLEKSRTRVKKYLEPLLKNFIIVVCGFLGISEDGKITTLGRGGSDTTAMILANCLNAKEIFLVKQTDGVMSADPNIVPEAKPLKSLDIHEMFALSYGGAKIMKVDALKYKIPGQNLRIVNYHAGLNSEGTIIKGVFNSKSVEMNKKSSLYAISIICQITPDNLSKLFAFFEDKPIYGVSTGRESITIFTNKDENNFLVNNLHSINFIKALSAKKNIGLIELTHPIFVNSPGWIAKISQTLVSENINIVEMTTSKATINIFLEESNIEKAFKTLRKCL